MHLKHEVRKAYSDNSEEKIMYLDTHNLYEFKIINNGLRDHVQEKSLENFIVKNGGKYEWSIDDNGVINPQRPPKGFGCICEAVTKWSHDQGFKDTQFPDAFTKVMKK